MGHCQRFTVFWMIEKYMAVSGLVMQVAFDGEMLLFNLKIFLIRFHYRGINFNS